MKTDNYLEEFIGSAGKMPAIDVIRRYQRVFLNTDDGQWVFVHILEQLKFMAKCDNEREMELNNFAKILMEIVFCDIEKKAVNNHRVVEFLKKKMNKIRRK